MKPQIHTSTIVDDGAIIGENTKIWHFTHISSKVIIGKNCSLGQNVFVGNNVIIGDNVKIQNNVSIYDGVILEDNVFCGPSMTFTNVINPRSHINRKDKFQKTIVKIGATIGANATIICGVELGEYSLVGAGTVVKKNVHSYETVVGVPASHLGWVCQCGEKLLFDSNNKSHCNFCHKDYYLEKQRCNIAKN